MSITRLLVAVYLAMALVTGISRARECEPGSMVHARTEQEGPVLNVLRGAIWPYTLYRHWETTGSVDGFLTRNGLCDPVAPKERR